MLAKQGSTGVVAVLAWLAMAVVGAAAMAQEDAVDLVPDPAQMMRIEAAVDQALEHLMRHQRADGSWPAGVGQRNNGVTALCLLAYLGSGHTPSRGPYRTVVERAIAFLLATQRDNGLFASPNASHGPMYEHALATLAIIEASGYARDPALRQSAQKAVDLIVRSQNDQGGWRYHPGSNDADLSVTVMQVVALRAAVNARMRVPQETLDKALRYVRHCAVPNGGFGYQGPSGPAPGRTAAGILSMQLLGAHDDEQVDRSFDWLRDRRLRHNQGHFWYMSYYGMQAAFQAGGRQWTQWHPQVRQFLLDNQNADGSWPAYSEGNIAGDTLCYSTALGAMCLQVYMHYLPAYQR